MYVLKTYWKLRNNIEKKGRSTLRPYDSSVDMARMSTKSGTLSAIVRAFKSAATKSIREINETFAWQRNYYEHIIRNEDDYIRIAEYINNNPAKWYEDRFYNEAENRRCSAIK